MKIHIAKYEPDRMGGGWTFSRNLAKGLGQAPYKEADIYLIPSSSMVDREEVKKAKQDGKKIILRIDNHLLPSRNRNTGMQKMEDFAHLADMIIYQSWWAFDYLNHFTPTDTPKYVVLNGVDTELFKPKEKNDRALYIRSSRIEEKGWEMARFWYSSHKYDVGGLDIVGKFSEENINYNFDFINNENYRFWGIQQQSFLADLMSNSKYFLYSYFMDACSNTLLEARASGCEIIDVYGMLKTGGAPEIMACEDISLERMWREYEQLLSSIA